MVPTVRLGTNLRHTLGAHRSVARSQLVKTTDLDFLQVRFFVGHGTRERRAPSTPFSRGAVDASGASPNASLKSEKIRWILPKFVKESVDLPDFVKDSVAVLQILLTF